MRIKFLRIFPEMWARTSCPLGSATRNMVPGNTWVTVPCNAIGSSFATKKYSVYNPATQRELVSTRGRTMRCLRFEIKQTFNLTANIAKLIGP